MTKLEPTPQGQVKIPGDNHGVSITVSRRLGSQWEWNVESAGRAAHTLDSGAAASVEEAMAHATHRANEILNPAIDAALVETDSLEMLKATVVELEVGSAFTIPHETGPKRFVKTVSGYDAEH